MVIRWLANTAIVMVSIVVALGAVELGLRWFYPLPMGVWHQDREGLALHWPGLVTYLPQFGLTVSFNSAGMRDGEHFTAKAPGVFRILVLGDSFIEALQVPFEESFPSLLQNELADRGPGRIEVINASVSGWGTDDELKYLTSYGRQLKPDLIIVAMTLYNDVSDNLRERFHTLRDGVLVERPSTRASFLDYKITQTKGLLASHFQIYQVMIRAKRARETRVEAQQLSAHVSGLFSATNDARMARGLELTRLLLARMKGIATEDGSQVALVLIPLGVQLSDRQFAEFVSQRSDGAVPAQIDWPQQEMKGLARRAGVDVIDLLPGFREWAASGGAPLYLTRDGHWDRPGHRLAARIVASDLVRLGLARR
jgi:hypothetical protein